MLEIEKIPKIGDLRFSRRKNLLEKDKCKSWLVKVHNKLFIKCSFIQDLTAVLIIIAIHSNQLQASRITSAYFSNLPIILDLSTLLITIIIPSLKQHNVLCQEERNFRCHLKVFMNEMPCIHNEQLIHQTKIMPGSPVSEILWIFLFNQEYLLIQTQNKWPIVFKDFIKSLLQNSEFQFPSTVNRYIT